MSAALKPAMEAGRALHLRPIFAVGQIWETREPDAALSADHWRIEAITDYPTSRVIGRHDCGAIRCFGLDGHHDSEPDEGGLDLVTLVRDAAL